MALFGLWRSAASKAAERGHDYHTSEALKKAGHPQFRAIWTTGDYRYFNSEVERDAYDKSKSMAVEKSLRPPYQTQQQLPEKVKAWFRYHLKKANLDFDKAIENGVKEETAIENLKIRTDEVFDKLGMPKDQRSIGYIMPYQGQEDLDYWGRIHAAEAAIQLHNLLSPSGERYTYGGSSLTKFMQWDKWHFHGHLGIPIDGAQKEKQEHVPLSFILNRSKVLNSLAALQQHDFQHETLAKVFTKEQLTDLHQRELYAEKEAAVLALQIIPLQVAARMSHKKDLYDHLRNQLLIFIDLCDEQKAIRQHITDVKRAINPTAARQVHPGKRNDRAPQ